MSAEAPVSPSAAAPAPAAAVDPAGPVSPSSAAKAKETPLPAAAFNRFLSPREKREAFAAAEVKRSKVDADRKAKLDAVKAAGAAKSLTGKKKLLKHKADEAKKEKKAYAAFEKAQAREADVVSPTKGAAGAIATPRVAGGIKLGMKVAVNTGTVKAMKVLSVVRDGAAYVAGLEEGDLIRSAAGRTIASKDDWDKTVATFKPLAAYPFIVLRDGTTVTCMMHCKSSAAPAPAANGAQSPPPAAAAAAPASAQ